MNTFKPESKDMDDERKFLEGLLKERFNFFIVMAPIYLFGVFQAQITPIQRVCALAFGLVVFALFCAAIWRTNSLINKALDALRGDENHPYEKLSVGTAAHPRANDLLVAISVAFVILIGVLLVMMLCGTTQPA
jgi:hypothetical protein